MAGMFRFWEMMKLTSVSQGSCLRIRIPFSAWEALHKKGSRSGSSRARMAA